MKYARRCSITSEGMNKGWVWGDGIFYTKYEKDTLAELRKDYPWKSWCSDDELIDWAVYTEEVLYYTEWEDESEYQYEEVYGELIEIQ